MKIAFNKGLPVGINGGYIMMASLSIPFRGDYHAVD